MKSEEERKNTCYSADGVTALVVPPFVGPAAERSFMRYVFPLSGIVFFSVDLDRRNVPFFAQQPYRSTSKWTLQSGRSIAFGIEDRRNLGIDELSGIKFANALLERFHIGRPFVAAHAAFV